MTAVNAPKPLKMELRNAEPVMVAQRIKAIFGVVLTKNAVALSVNEGILTISFAYLF